MHGRDAAPALSVILPTSDDFSGVRLTVRALHAQTVRHRIELVLVVPDDDPGIIESEVSGFAKVTIVVAGPVVTSNRSRVAGIRAASAPIVALAEDHSFPDADWAEALITAHDHDYAVVGPVIRNANPRSMLSWANLLLEYGPWFEGSSGGDMPDVPGHNSAYRRSLLMSYGDELDEIFEVEAVVQRDLRAKGHKLFLEPRAKANHLNFSRLRPSLTLRLNAGRSFAGYRTLGWSFPKRALYAVASPLIPVVRFVRIVRFLNRSRSYRFLIPRVLPLLSVALITDGFGELLGYVFGPGRSPTTLGEIEFDRMRFMNSHDRLLLSNRIEELDASRAEMAAFAG
ncbi:MAG: glycosyltransferase [Gemmatimonas sp.]